jgi:hypothetical protein
LVRKLKYYYFYTSFEWNQSCFTKISILVNLVLKLLLWWFRLGTLTVFGWFHSETRILMILFWNPYLDDSVLKPIFWWFRSESLILIIPFWNNNLDDSVLKLIWMIPFWNLYFDDSVLKPLFWWFRSDTLIWMIPFWNLMDDSVLKPVCWWFRSETLILMILLWYPYFDDSGQSPESRFKNES